MEQITVKYRALEDAQPPVYATDGAAGCDIYSNVDFEIRPGESYLIPTGIYLEIPEGFECQVRPRSGLAKKGLVILNSPGTIDSDYRGEVQILLANLAPPIQINDGILSRSVRCAVADSGNYSVIGSNQFVIVITKGDRIAQLVFAPVVRARFVHTVDLGKTKRGAGGFGSTGQ